MEGLLESEEAARRLGVKVSTLYAYVSRGRLNSYRSPRGRRSLFDVDEVERLARRSRSGRSSETRLTTITTGVTQLTEVGPVYRGTPAVDLAADGAFEDAAHLLWGGAEPADGGREERWQALPVGAPPELPASDRLRWAVVMAGALDPLRADLRPIAVLRSAGRVIATMVASLGPEETGEARQRTAADLTAAIAPRPGPGVVDAVDAALVLLADHELATSTVAVRVAASTRADLYDALLAGLATMAGPLHGGASQLVGRLLADAERMGVDRAVRETLRWQGRLPGFGHPVYADGDPRFVALRRRFESFASDSQIEIVASIVELAAAHDVPPPNVDLALAAVTWAADMTVDAGRTIFSVARVAGWVAHYLEELGERPLRFRARAIYATPTVH